MKEENKALTPEQDYRKNFMPGVHRIGAFTMAVATILTLLPVIYFVVVKGYTLSWSTYIAGILAVISFQLGSWLTEPETFWPVLGSAGTYIGYLSGNVMAMRFPVAVSVQKNMKADINTPRGQVATIVGIVGSVISNLIMLLIIVLLGDWILSILPEAVLHAFGYCVVAMMAAMMIMNLQGEAGVTKTFVTNLPYIVCSIIMWFVINKGLTFLGEYGTIITLIICILLGYVRYRRDKAALEASAVE